MKTIKDHDNLQSVTDMLWETLRQAWLRLDTHYADDMADDIEEILAGSQTWVNTAIPKKAGKQ